MNELFYLLYMLLLTVSMINTVHLGLYIAGANLYDISQLRRPRLPKRGRRALVSVVVPAHNEELVIERCLDSIRRSNYKKVEVFVHNDLSTDRTRQVVRAYQSKYPKFSLRLVNRRHQAGKAGGVNYCIKRYAKGEFVMTLDADCVLRKDAIRNAVSYFINPKVMGVAANVRLIDKPTVLGILQKFEHMIGYRAKKFYSLSNCEFIVGGVASTYRRDILKKVRYYDIDTVTEDIGLSLKVVALGNRDHRIVYGADVVAMTEGVHNINALLRQRYRWKMGGLQNLFKYTSLVGSTDPAYTKSLTWYRLPMAFFGEVLLLTQPLFLPYLVFVMVYYRTALPILGAYIVMTFYALVTIWFDEHSSARYKTAMSLYAPLLYFVFYIMDAVQIISIMRCLKHPDQIKRLGKHQTTWISPERAGQKALFS